MIVFLLDSIIVRADRSSCSIKTVKYSEHYAFHNIQQCQTSIKKKVISISVIVNIPQRKAIALRNGKDTVFFALITVFIKHTAGAAEMQ